MRFFFNETLISYKSLTIEQLSIDTILDDISRSGREKQERNVGRIVKIIYAAFHKYSTYLSIISTPTPPFPDEKRRIVPFAIF